MPETSLRKLSEAELISFTRELGLSLASGSAVPAALDGERPVAKTQRARELSIDLAERMRAGSGLAQAMAAHPGCFPPFYLQLIASAERTGRLPVFVRELARFWEWQRNMRRLAFRSFVYPAAMVGTVLLLTFVLVLFVFPRFIPSIDGVGFELPVALQIILITDAIFRHHTIEIGLVVIVAPIAYQLAMSFQSFRDQVDLLKLRIPIFGPVAMNIFVSRLAHHAAIVHAAGMDTEKRIRQIRQLDEVARTERFFPKEPPNGKWEEPLNKMCTYYDAEVPKSIKRMFRIVEPLILIMMASIVLFFASAVLSPISMGITIIKPP